MRRKIDKRPSSDILAPQPDFNPIPSRPHIDQERLQRAFDLLQALVDHKEIRGCAAVIAHRGQIVGEYYAGIADPATAQPVTAETIFALASITKPATAAALMALVERGECALDEPIWRFVPEFVAPSVPWPADQLAMRWTVTLRHLLTHTSGLPGSLAENDGLRSRQQPLAAFVEAACHTPLRFMPGTQFCYSNVAVSLTGEIIARLSGLSYPAALKSLVFDPMGLRNTFLPLPSEQASRVATVEGANFSGTPHETFNSAYFRGLGIPWGGMYATARDVAMLAGAFLPSIPPVSGIAQSHGTGDFLGSAAKQTMISLQVQVPPAAAHPSDDMNAQAWPIITWGLGWDVKGPKLPHMSGDLTSPATFGHVGASGTMVWADPATSLVCVLLTNQALSTGWAADPPMQARFSNTIAAALIQ